MSSAEREQDGRPEGMAPDGSGQRLHQLERLAGWMDDRFHIPGTGIRFGLDSLLGLVPGIGDAATALISIGLVLEARRLNIPNRTLACMIANIAADMLVGSIPLVGDLFDVAFKANRRNMTLLREHLDPE